MPIKLDDERTVFPASKFNAVGDHISIAVIRVETLPLTAYGTSAPIMGANGQPRTQSRVTGMVISSTCTIKDGDNHRPAVEGELVSLYIKGLSRWEFFEAKKKIDGGLQVGDVLRWTYTGDKPGQAPGTTKKVYTVDLKHPSEGKIDRTERCEELYRQLTSQPVGGEQVPPPTDEDYDEFADE